MCCGSAAPPCAARSMRCRPAGCGKPRDSRRPVGRCRGSLPHPIVNMRRLFSHESRSSKKPSQPRPPSTRPSSTPSCGACSTSTCMAISTAAVLWTGRPASRWPAAHHGGGAAGGAEPGLRAGAEGGAGRCAGAGRTGGPDQGRAADQLCRERRAHQRRLARLRGRAEERRHQARGLQIRGTQHGFNNDTTRFDASAAQQA